MRAILRPALIAGLALAGCQKPSGDGAAVRERLRADEAQWNADYKTRDIARIAAHYAPDATLVTPGQAAVSGSAGVAEALKSLLSDPAFSLQFAADKMGVASSGDLAYARGPFHMTISDGLTPTPILRTGSYLTIYRKQADGSWKAIETITSLGPPSPIPPH